MARLAVALDATCLIGRPTGIGVFCAGALSGLARRPDVAVSAFAVSWRRRHVIGALVPTGVGVAQRAMPARPLRHAWRRTELPPIEWFIGRTDVVHGANFVVPPTRRAARVASVHDLVTVRFPELCDPATLVYPALVRRAIGHGAWVHADSSFVAAEVVDILGAHPDRVRVVHPGVPPLPVPEAGGAAWRPPGLPPSVERYVLAVGTVEPRKDYPLLVAAFAEVAATRPDVGLVIVGSKGWGTEQFDAALARVEAPVRARVVVTGYLEDADLGAALHGASVLAYPSVYEGFGFPPLQAMAAGVPVVATRAGSVPEVVGDAAALVDAGDKDGLAGGLAEALDGDPWVSERVERGRARVARFSWDVCADGLVRLYQDALAERRS